MVKDVNAKEVSPEERLSDNVYHYDSKDHVFELAEKFEARQQEKKTEIDEKAEEKGSIIKDLKDKQKEAAAKPPVKDAAEKFKEVQEAYAVLSDESKRRQYDQYGHAAFTNASGGFSGFDGFDFSGMEDIFGDLFGNMFGGRSSHSSSNRRQDGADLLYRMTISFDEAVHGTKRDIKVEVEDECDNCKGQGGFGSHTCPECKGTGTVTKQQSTMFGSFLSRTTCSHCGGTGTSFDRICTDCHGKEFKKYLFK